jgi:hypothetical protein
MAQQGGAAAKVCRYECPLCGKRGEKLSTHADARTRTANELCNHVRMTEDEAHGPGDSLPDENTLGDPLAHVEVEVLAD